MPNMSASRNKISIDPNPRRAGNEWHLEACFPNGKTLAITGFKTDAEAKDWLGSSQHIAWLREIGC